MLLLLLLIMPLLLLLLMRFSVTGSRIKVSNTSTCLFSIIQPENLWFTSPISPFPILLSRYDKSQNRFVFTLVIPYLGCQFLNMSVKQALALSPRGIFTNIFRIFCWRGTIDNILLKCESNCFLSGNCSFGHCLQRLE